MSLKFYDGNIERIGYDFYCDIAINIVNKREALGLTQAELEEVNNHANKFSKTINSKNSVWKSNFDAMAKKKVLRNLLSKWGILSIEMQKAYTADEGLINKEFMDDVENVQANVDDIQEYDDVVDVNYTIDSNGEILEGQENMFEGTPLEE